MKNQKIENRKWKIGIGLAFFALSYSSFPILPAFSAPQNSWQSVEKALGRAGGEADGVYRVTFPRSDLRVRIGGVTVKPALALTSWAAFQPEGSSTMVMGDLVLLSREVNPVISKLSEGGIEITAVHNHLLDERPRVMYLHYHGDGDAGQLAATLRSAWTSPPATRR